MHGTFETLKSVDFSTKIIDCYTENAQKFTGQYESLAPAEVFGSAISLFPMMPSFTLDIGAGSGRDAAWMARQGHIVTAVEPSDGMRKLAIRTHADQPITWVADRLPELKSVKRPEGGFDFILISAVWMHLVPEDRAIAFKRLAELVSTSGTILISLRHGTSDPARPMLPINTAAEIENAKLAGFRLAKTVNTEEDDKLGRGDVHWELLQLSLKAE